MRRRDVSRLLVNIGAVSAVGSGRAVAQAHTLPSYPATPAEPPGSVVNTEYPPGNVLRYGADPSGGKPSTAAIQNAILAASSNPVAINGITTYTGGVVYFPKGSYLVQKSQIVITTVGLTFQGEGSRNFQDFKLAPTAIIIDGRDSDGSDFGFKFTSTENSRNFTAKDISFEYCNSFAGDMFFSGSAGMSFERCSFGSTSVSSVRPATANSLLRLFNGHHYRIFDCSFTDAQHGIIIDNDLAPNTNGWMIHGCAFYDFTNSFITVIGSGAIGLDIAACEFDPIYLNPADGVVLSGVGFCIHGCTFGGANVTNCPISSWLSINGDGVVSGCYFAFQPQSRRPDAAAILATGGNVQVSSNRITATQGLIASGACSLVGAGNYYVHLGGGTADIAVQLSQESRSYTNAGPDMISTGFAHSYAIGAASVTEGQISYSAGTDSSLGGPTYRNRHSSIRLNPMDVQLDATTTGDLVPRQCGRSFAPTLPATFTLPGSSVAAGSLEYRFIKLGSGGLTIKAGAGTTILDTSPKTKIAANVSSEIGASITIRYLDSTRAVVVQKNGTWR